MKFIDKITLPFYRIRNTFRDAYYNLKYRCQRFIRGYADEDVWGMDAWFIEGMQKLLPQYIKRTDGFPAIITFEEWKDILNEMLYCLNGMTIEGAEEQLFGKNDELTFQQIKEIEVHIETNTKRFFELYTKWFDHLWY